MPGRVCLSIHGLVECRRVCRVLPTLRPEYCIPPEITRAVCDVMAISQECVIVTNVSPARDLTCQKFRAPRRKVRGPSSYGSYAVLFGCRRCPVAWAGMFSPWLEMVRAYDLIVLVIRGDWEKGSREEKMHEDKINRSRNAKE